MVYHTKDRDKSEHNCECLHGETLASCDLDYTIQYSLLLYTYCDILLGKRKSKSRPLQVKFDLDWSDDCSPLVTTIV